MVVSGFEHDVLFLWYNVEVPGMGSGNGSLENKAQGKIHLHKALWGFWSKGSKSEGEREVR